GHLICNLKTTYRSKKPAKNLKMPGVYYVDRRLERIKEADKETYVEQHEVAVARYCDLPSKLGHAGGTGGSMSELITENMHMKLYMEGTVNNHHFKCTSEGEGKPYEGTQTMRIKVVEGGPLPFAFDILATSFMYGSKTFINHTQGIPDFFKQSFPEGFTWERVTTYEDGGVLTATQDTSLQDGCLIYNVKIRGVNFPSNGPVMQKKTLGWEASTEMLYPADGGLEGRSDMALKLV
uniref:Fluorescent protein FP480 n=1 Tax=Entacmaea quadricolor TaxID=6118 RepID=UPI000211B386